MEPVSALAAVVGLVTCLDTTLRALHSFMYSSAPRKPGASNAHIEDALTNISRDLSQTQSSLYATLKDTQVEELSDLLQDIEHHLEDLQAVIQSAEKHRKKDRWLRAFPRRRDTEAAATNLVLAKKVIHMIRTLQGHGHRAELRVDGVGSHHQASLEDLTTASKPKHHWPLLEDLTTASKPKHHWPLLEDLTTASKPKHHWPLLKAPSTKAEEMFAWIAGPEGQEKLHEQCRAERLAGTCEWFLAREEFKSWCQRPLSTADDGILWCRGRPGIGKTMLASKIIDELQLRHVVAYFYMSSAKLDSASDIVTNLLRQLCLPFHTVPSRLQQIFEKTNGEPGYRLELEDSLAALREASHLIHQPAIIVIDGLDETNVREQHDFVKVLDSLKDTSWKCLVTSRDAQYVLPNTYSSFSEFVIQDNANEQDINNFVKSVLEGNEPTHRMLNGDEELRSAVIETLTSRAHGMFYWATLQVRPILDQTHLSGIRLALGSIPSDIGEIVKSALKMIKMQDENRAELANRALALLTAAQVPLTAEAMCHALGLAHILDYEKNPSELSFDEIPNPQSITECCMGLIKIEPTTNIVTLAHYDILQEMRQQWDKIFAPKYTTRLAKTCIAYLSLAEFARGPCHEVDTFRKRLEEYPFLDYASHYWGYHARAALSLETLEDEIIGDVHGLLSQPMNLGLSLQVSEYRPGSKQKTLAIRPDHFLGVSELQIASRHGLAPIVRNLRRTSPELILNQDSCGKTALHEAAQAGWDDIVELLIEAGANPSLVDDEGKTPLSYAAESGHGKIIEILRSGHDQQALEEAFCDAAEAGKTSVVKELLDLGVDPNARKSGSSAITVASRRGHKSIVRLLLDRRASPSSLDRWPSDSIPLHQAIGNGNMDTAALLLDFGADIDARDECGRTALFETLNVPDIRGAALLLKNGIDISCCDSKGDNVLHEAARKGAVEHASRFVDRGIDVNIPNKEGLTPLHLASRYGNLEIAMLLLRKGAAVDDCDSMGWTPLMYAVSAGKTQSATMLSNSGADVKVMGYSQKNSLVPAEEAGHHWALRSPDAGRSDNTVILVTTSSKLSVVIRRQQGTETEQRSSSFNTPLTFAVEGRHAEIVRLLISHGADINHLGLPLTVAVENGLSRP